MTIMKGDALGCSGSFFYLEQHKGIRKNYFGESTTWISRVQSFVIFLETLTNDMELLNKNDFLIRNLSKDYYFLPFQNICFAELPPLSVY